MSDTAITTTAVSDKARPAPVGPPAPVPDVRRKGLFFKILAPVASLRITVVLFALSLLLVFFGTLAQMNAGIWTVVNQYFRSWGFVWVPLQLFVQLGQVFFGVSRDTVVAGSFPFPKGFTLGSLMLVNLLAAHIVRFRLSWKRAGILVLHAGLIVLMVSEFITATWAVEGNMTIEAGGSANYLEHRDYNEIAIIDHSGARDDEVVVIPDNLLRRGGLIHNDLLPFDVQVVRYMVNSALVEGKKAKEIADNPATRGDGRDVVAVERPEVSGTSQEQKVDLASAYVTFRRKGSEESLGTYLVSLWLTLASDRPQQVTVGDKTYDVALRFKRSYQPYTVSLLKFHHEVYPGTDKPKDFSSYVRLVDPTRGEDREARIWMNHPLRYAGETFYQSSFLEGDAGTVLQVVRNPGWLLPYIACFLVAIGMLFHFFVKLADFLVKSLPRNDPHRPEVMEANIRRSRRSPWLLRLAVLLWVANLVVLLCRRIFAPDRRVPGHGERAADWIVPSGVLGLAGIFLVLQMVPPGDRADQFHFQEAARLPVLDGGRIKPLDTLARTDLMVISGKQEFEDNKGVTQPAVKWLLDVVTSRLTEQMSGEAAPARTYKVFRIDNPEVLNLLDLQRRPGYRYAIDEFADKLGLVEKEASRASALQRAGHDLDVYDRRVLELAEHLGIYVNLARWGGAMLVPPRPGADANDWRTLADAYRELKANRDADPMALALFKALGAYTEGNARDFNANLADYQKAVDRDLPAATGKTGLEVFYNDFAPFFWCLFLYVFAFLLACLSWLIWRDPLRRSAFWLMVLAFLVHTWGLGTRMYLQGRPPVTNLYSSAVFIGWGCVLFGIIFERIYRIGIATAVASLTGFAAVFIAHHLALSGDSLEMMQAVLDTNLWLATHVTCVTLGYTATFLAGFIGLTYLFVRAVARLVDPRLNTLQVDLGTGQKMDLFRVLSQMLYGVICFAMLFSFVGTVLGGIWADQSWGRFWGWDPKENGALLIVIWNALILHARWGGIVKSAGVARLAIVGNMITGWSWFGTNQLGVGLHAYGFNKNLADGLAWFWISQVTILVFEALTRVDWMEVRLVRFVVRKLFQQRSPGV